MIIHSEPLYAYEAYTMYQSFLSERERYSDRESPDFKTRIDAIYDTCATAMSSLTLSHSEISEILKTYGSGNALDAWEPFYFLYQQFGVSPDNARKEMTARLHEFALFHLGKAKPSDVDTLPLFDLIKNASLSASEKWILLWIDKDFEYLAHQLNEALEILVPHVKKATLGFKDDVALLVSQWTKRSEEQSLIAYFEKQFGVTLPNDTMPMYPSILANQALSIFSDDQLFIGLSYTDAHLETFNINDDVAHRAFKALGDRSKYAILKELVDSKKYGRELAESLDLTPATISYHIQDLLNSGVIQASATDTNRIYYEIRKDKIKEVFAFVTAEFKL
ncbi:ArsR family transcriptional regulator [Erysipelothrix sp. HDW6C]|uniref:winged helix-turn-helix domain-containing protein n=1 Tax=Erysipelothrix sp. HDW6C TaxID=2714930 RepID=UPI001409DA50|nr:winged helix-turn-helix domain-containing protein [Erysipelothrix sp. HDW6C]QIK68793.1 ArsR family transcriptional regulator [Erysipelothrix sp. HDW6C]